MQGSKNKSPLSLLCRLYSSSLFLRWPIHPLQACSLSFNGNKGDRPFCLHTVLLLSRALSLYCSLVWLWKRTVLPWQPIISGQPAQTKKLAWFFFSPFSFSVFSASTSSFFYLHAALLMFCFCFQKRLISKREKEKQLQTSRYRRQHVTSKPLLVYLYVSACQMIILCCAVHYAKIRLPDNKLWGVFFFVLHCNITEHCAGLPKC